MAKFLQLQPLLDDFEAKRKECLGKWSKVLTFVWLVVVGVVIAILAADFESNDFIFVPFIIGGVLSVTALHWCTKDFKTSFKQQIVEPVVEGFADEIDYKSESRVPQRDYFSSKLFLKGVDRYRGEDYVVGKIGETDFKFSELHTEYKTTTRDSKGRRRTRWHTIFKGVFFIADFHKDFKGRTFVLPDTFEKLLGRWGQKLQSVNFSRPDLVKLEDPEFEKEFRVYGDDQIEARYLLSSSMMRRILEFKEKVGSKVHISFAYSKIYIAISSSKNRFEPRIFAAVNDPSLIEEYLADLELITGIIEDLNLNTRIWSKV